MPGMDIGRAGAHGNEQRVFCIADLLADAALEVVDGTRSMVSRAPSGQVLSALAYSMQVWQVMVNPGGTGRPSYGHLGKVRALAAEDTSSYPCCPR